MRRPLRLHKEVPLGRTVPQQIYAGEYFTMNLTVKIPYDIPQGETISLVTMYPRWIHCGIEVQSTAPSKQGYVSASINNSPLNGVCSDPKCKTKASFVVPKKGLKKGQNLNLIIGDKSNNSPGALCTNYSIKNTIIAVTLEKASYQIKFEEYHIKCLCAFVIDILGGPLSALKVYAPSQAICHKPFSICIRPQDKFGNVNFENPIKISVRWDHKKLEKNIKRCDRNKVGTVFLKNIKIKRPGLHYLDVESIDKGLKTSSNPIEVRETKYELNLYWGLIHEHTELSDGESSIDNCFMNLRDGARMDFGASADHDHVYETTEAMWREACKAVKGYNSHNQFIAFLSYEWAKWRKNGDGDRNVYYFEDDKPMFRSETGQYDTPQKLFKALKKYKALIIPHHTAYTGNFCDWKDHDPEKEKLVEIYSVWGNSECSTKDRNPFPVRRISALIPKPSEQACGFVQNALKLGWRVGFTAGGDMHLAHPGDDVKKGISPMDYKTGITGVWAKDLTRNSIWEALIARRTFATTSSRIILKFWVNKNIMGKEIHLKSKSISRKVAFEIIGSDTINKIEIIRNNEVVYCLEKINKNSIDSLWIDKEKFDKIAFPPTKWCNKSFIFYYLRVTLAGNEMAWSSPIWIDVIDHGFVAPCSLLC